MAVSRLSNHINRYDGEVNFPEKAHNAVKYDGLVESCDFVTYRALNRKLRHPLDGSGRNFFGDV